MTRFDNLLLNQSFIHVLTQAWAEGVKKIIGGIQGDSLIHLHQRLGK